MTQGLDVDIEFDGINNFKGISERDSGELSVFEYAGVELVHGWLADPSSPEEYEALMRAGSYEGAQITLVNGMEAETKTKQVDKRLGEEITVPLSPEDEAMIQDGMSPLKTLFFSSAFSNVEAIFFDHSPTCAAILVEHIVTIDLSRFVWAFRIGAWVPRGCE